jgi:hypothetical protein
LIGKSANKYNPKPEKTVKTTKKNKLILLAIALMTSGASLQAQLVEQLFTNTSFESGGTGWAIDWSQPTYSAAVDSATTFGITADPGAGDYVLKLTGDAGWVQQNATARIAADTSYTLSYDIWLDSSNPQWSGQARAYFMMNNGDEWAGPYSQFYTTPDISNPNADYLKGGQWHSVSRTVDASFITANPHLIGTIIGVAFSINPQASGGITYYVDNVRLTAVPTYALWAAANAGGLTANLDYDSDGVSNGVEYFMNAAPGFTANPALVGGTVTWPNGGNIPSSAYGSQFQVQKSTDLANWSAVASDDITLSNTAGALTWKVASIANGDMGSFTGNLPSSWGVSGGNLTSASSADNSPFTNKLADNGNSWLIDDSTDAVGTAGFLQAFSNKTNYPSVEVNFDFKLTELTGGTWGIQFDGAGASAIAASSVHYRIDASGQFAINAGPGTGVITNILTLEADKWYNVRATFTTTAVNTGSNEGTGVQSGTITPAGGSPVSWSNVPLLNTSLGFSRLLVRDRDATFAGDLLLDNVSVAPQGKEFVRLKATPN